VAATGLAIRYSIAVLGLGLEGSIMAQQLTITVTVALVTGYVICAAADPQARKQVRRRHRPT